MKKGKQEKCGKNLKQRFTVAFFVKAADEKVLVVTWKSGVPHCFRGLRDSSRPAIVH